MPENQTEETLPELCRRLEKEVADLKKRIGKLEAINRGEDW